MKRKGKKKNRKQKPGDETIEIEINDKYDFQKTTKTVDGVDVTIVKNQHGVIDENFLLTDDPQMLQKLGLSHLSSLTHLHTYDNEKIFKFRIHQDTIRLKEAYGSFASKNEEYIKQKRELNPFYRDVAVAKHPEFAISQNFNDIAKQTHEISWQKTKLPWIKSFKIWKSRQPDGPTFDDLMRNAQKRLDDQLLRDIAFTDKSYMEIMARQDKLQNKLKRDLGLDGSKPLTEESRSGTSFMDLLIGNDLRRRRRVPRQDEQDASLKDWDKGIRYPFDFSRVAMTSVRDRSFDKPRVRPHLPHHCLNDEGRKTRDQERDRREEEARAGTRLLGGLGLPPPLLDRKGGSFEIGFRDFERRFRIRQAREALEQAARAREEAWRLEEEAKRHRRRRAAESQKLFLATFEAQVREKERQLMETAQKEEEKEKQEGEGLGMRLGGIGLALGRGKGRDKNRQTMIILPSFLDAKSKGKGEGEGEGVGEEDSQSTSTSSDPSTETDKEDQTQDQTPRDKNKDRDRDRSQDRGRSRGRGRGTLIQILQSQMNMSRGRERGRNRKVFSELDANPPETPSSSPPLPLPLPSNPANKPEERERNTPVGGGKGRRKNQSGGSIERGSDGIQLEVSSPSLSPSPSPSPSSLSWLSSLPLPSPLPLTLAGLSFLPIDIDIFNRNGVRGKVEREGEGKEKNKEGREEENGFDLFSLCLPFPLLPFSLLPSLPSSPVLSPPSLEDSSLLGIDSLSSLPSPAARWLAERNLVEGLASMRRQERIKEAEDEKFRRRFMFWKRFEDKKKKKQGQVEVDGEGLVMGTDDLEGETHFDVADLVDFVRGGDVKGVLDALDQGEDLLTGLGPNSLTSEGTTPMFEAVLSLISLEKAPPSPSPSPSSESSSQSISLGAHSLMDEAANTLLRAKQQVIATTLLHRGGDINMTVPYGEGLGLVHKAIEKAAPLSLDWVLSHKGDPSLRTRLRSLTPLMIACLTSSPTPSSSPSPVFLHPSSDMLLALLSRGGVEGLDLRDRNGETALHHTARSGSEDAIRILITCGASTIVRNRDGLSPAELALSVGRTALSETLRSFKPKFSALDLRALYCWEVYGSKEDLLSKEKELSQAKKLGNPI